MAQVAGRPFLEHLLDYWIDQGVSRFILSVGYLKDVVTSHFGTAYRGNPVDYVFESTPLGTGGGLLKVMAEKQLSSRFLLLNGDTFFCVPLAEFLAFHEAKSADLSIALLRSDAAGRYGGIEVDASGRITDFSVQGSGRNSWINGGVYLADLAALKRIPSRAEAKVSLEAELIPSLSRSGGKLFGFPCQAKFLDIGIPEDYERASSIIASTNEQ